MGAKCWSQAYFTNEETEAQNVQGAWCGSHSQETAGLVLEVRSAHSQGSDAVAHPGAVSTLLQREGHHTANKEMGWHQGKAILNEPRLSG